MRGPKPSICADFFIASPLDEKATFLRQTPLKINPIYFNNLQNNPQENLPTYRLVGRIGDVALRWSWAHGTKRTNH